jgi:hypothetical protein
MTYELREYIYVVMPDGTKRKFKTVYGEFPVEVGNIIADALMEEWGYSKCQK